LRILLLNQFFPPDTAATGQLLADVARGLSAGGHEVHVVCSRGGYSGGRADGAPLVGLDRVRVSRVGATARGRVRALDRLCDWGSYYALAAGQSLRLGRFDSCLALTTPPFIGLVGLMLKRLRRTRLVVWTMDLWPDVAEAAGTVKKGGMVAHRLRGLARHQYCHADAVVSLGSAMTGRLVRLGVPRGRIATVHNWVPSEGVRPLPWGRCHLDRLRYAAGRFVVMYSGNMGVAHEFDTILDAAEQLEGDDSVLLLFVGDGKRRGEVAREVAKRGLGNVRLEPRVPLGRLSELLGSAGVHLVSMREGMEGILVPSKVYGILAAGRPAVMVGSTQNEVADLVRDSGAGFVVGAGEAGKLAAAVRQLRDRPGLARRMGAAGRRYYERRLGRDRSVRAIVQAVTGADGRAAQEGPPRQASAPHVSQREVQRV
jgi:glycosyltransferase involved in cell wall biosynthesis